ncbi:MAG: phosphoribosylformylglycinamidine cyclo-ligase [Planctomycetaceae bacterium]|nr:MAG: phosphoribosylformylglycinamidine cyclo-ligase [Planctomycetaceae bacterium]
MSEHIPREPLTYRGAGVDLDLYDEAMSRLPRLMAATHTRRVIPLADSFAGLFRLNHVPGGRPSYHEPVLVSGTDGVGTKLKIAQMMNRHDTVGIDLVAMCANDCLCMGAEPLFFLDYLALPADHPDLIEELVKGISEGCCQAGLSLLGGETAILPEVYRPGEYDLAGFAVHVVERERLIDGQTIKPGDVAVGLASSGFHSNGYSLIRRAVLDRAQMRLTDFVPELQRRVGEVLLTPTRIYVSLILALLQRWAPRCQVTGLAHITGGGLKDNLERILPSNCQLRIRRQAWPVPPEFAWLQRIGPIDWGEMYRTFNMGIGFVLLLRADVVDAVISWLQAQGQDAWIIGEVESAAQRSVCWVE